MEEITFQEKGSESRYGTFSAEKKSSARGFCAGKNFVNLLKKKILLFMIFFLYIYLKSE